MPTSMVKSSLRRRACVVLAVATAVALIGCGAEPRSDASRSPGVSHAVLARISKSVSTAGCRPLAEHVKTRGTVFAVGESQALTAYHVVRSSCFAHSELTLFGGRTAVVAATSPAHGLALLHLIGDRTETALRPARAHIGEHLALVGYPNGRVQARLRVTHG